MEQASFAVRKCPFLQKVAAQHGEDYAVNLAICPTAPAGEAAPAGSDHQALYAESFRLFHGPQGIVPLATSSNKPQSVSGCPFHAQVLAAAESSKGQTQPQRAPLPLATISLSFGSGPNFGDFLRKKAQQNSSSKPQRSAGHGHRAGNSGAPNAGPGGAGPGSQHPASNPGSSAAGSSGGFKPQRPLTDPSSGASGGGGLAGASHRSSWNPAGGGHGPQPPSAAAGHAPLSSNPKAAGPGSAGTGGSASMSKGGWLTVNNSSGATAGAAPSNSCRAPGAPPSGPRATGSSNPAGSSGKPRSGSSGAARGGNGRRLAGSNMGGSSGNPAAGRGPAAGSNPAGCPLRRWLGPMAGLVFNEYDKLACPPAIVAARAALAKTAAVQTLRPQALPVKLVAVAAVAAAANLPCGAVREHFEKFSTGWFIAVHATIPFVAMLRKAVVMPKYAMLVTIAAAVLGQMVGSRLERARLQQQMAVQLTAQLRPVTTSAALSPRSDRKRSELQHDGSAHGSDRDHKGTAAWMEKLLAGAAAGFAAQPLQQQQQQLSAAAADCMRGIVTGLGSLMPQLPVVRA